MRGGRVMVAYYTGPMRLDVLIGPKVLWWMLALCFVLTAEEFIHLGITQSHRWSTPITLRDQCVRKVDRIYECRVPGYGKALFLCSAKGCMAKEPATGMTITPKEEQLFAKFY
jgi:hypothetical protein